VSDAFDDIGFVINMNDETITWEGGYTIPIDGKYDRYGIEIDDPKQVVFVTVTMPPDGVVVTLDLRDLIQEPDREHLH
jgi:hypothetical protein